METQDLLSSLGLRRLGRPSFDVIASNNTVAEVCMDLAGVAIVSNDGGEVESNRESVKVYLELDSGLIAQFQVGEPGCL